MSKEVNVYGKIFREIISEEKIQAVVIDLAIKLNSDLQGKEVVFLGILNGAFMFAADLFRQIRLPCQINFLKLASYQGGASSGMVRQLIGINQELKGKTVVILEDIVDTGTTLNHIMMQLRGFEPAEILVATFLFKPEVYEQEFKLDYVGLEIPNRFVIGYGLDYSGFGRNLGSVYQLAESQIS